MTGEENQASVQTPTRREMNSAHIALRRGEGGDGAEENTFEWT